MRLFYTLGITPALAWLSLALVVIAGIVGTYSVPPARPMATHRFSSAPGPKTRQLFYAMMA